MEAGERLMKKDLTPILRSLYFCIRVANNLRSRKELARMSIFFSRETAIFLAIERAAREGILIRESPPAAAAVRVGVLL